MPDASKEITEEPGAGLLPGTCAGAYRLEARCGEGGMGAVYRAFPAGDPAAGPVAVKVIKRGMDTASVLRRFENERQILGALDHPNIVQLLDAGSTADGLPYVVMEYIPGEPVTAYCDRHRLPVAARLELFCKICAAVECAHEKQVVHRDIKPSNILVTPAGEPKLLDFGIAKILDHGLLSLTGEQTLTQVPAMTPQYASPEQTRGEPVTTASDVYSLGVLLYELLSGHRPYRTATPAAHEAIRAICEQTPERPSAAVMRTGATSGITPAAAGAARAAAPEALRRRLAGDLDAIVLKALAKDPSRRYASAAGLGEEIRRHLEGRPIQTPRASVLALASGGVRRPWVAAAVAALAVAAGFSVHAWRSAAVKVRPSVAVLGFENLSRDASAEWLSTALTEMLSTELAAGGGLRTVPGERVSQVKLELALPNVQTLGVPTLERLRRSLGTDFVVLGSYLALGEGAAMQLRLDVRLQDTRSGEIVTAVAETGRYAGLLAAVTRTGTLLRDRLGTGPVPAGEAASLRVSLPENPAAARAYSEGLERLRHFDTLAARDLLRKAVELAPRHALSHAALGQVSALLGYDREAGEESRQALDLAAPLGREERLFIEGRYYESRREWNRAVDAYRLLCQAAPDNLEYGLRLAGAETQASNGRTALRTLQALRGLPAAGPDARIELAEAEAALAASDLPRARQAGARAAAAGEMQGLRILAARARLVESRIFAEMGDPPGALDAAAQARRLYAAAGHRQGAAWAMNEAAAVLVQTGDVEGASAGYAQALAICRAIGDQACIGTDLDSIGVLRRRQGDLVGALDMHRQALEVRRTVGDRAGVATALYNIGNAMETLGDLDGARAAETESLDIRRALGQKRTGALTMSRLADVRRRHGELAEALATSRDAVAELRAIGDRGGTAMVLYNLALVEFDRGNLPGSRAALEEALATRRSQRDKNNTAQVLAALARVAMAEDRLRDARQYLEESVALRQGLGERIGLAQSKLTLAALEIEEGHGAAAARLAREALVEFDRARASSLRVQAHLALARATVSRQPLDAARALLRESKERWLRTDLQLAAAQVGAAQGRRAEAVRLLQCALAEAGASGFVGLELEARLGLGRLGAAPLALVAADAAQQGYQLVARRAGGPGAAAHPGGSFSR